MEYVDAWERPEREGELAPNAEGSRRRTFAVMLDSKKGTAEFVTAHPLVPAPFEPYRLGPTSLRGYVAKRFQCRQYPNCPELWDVVVIYEPTDQPNDENQQNPIIRPPKIAWGSWEESLVMKTDSDGRKFNNTAGDPLPEAPEALRKHQTLQITRAELNFPSQVYRTYVQTVCSRSFAGYDRGCSCMWDITATYEFDAELGFYFAWVTYEVRFRDVEALAEDNWKWRPRNCGFNYKETIGSPKLAAFKAQDGENDVVPHDLAENGTKLADNAPTVYLRFRIRNFSSWAQLNLGF